MTTEEFKRHLRSLNLTTKGDYMISIYSGDDLITTVLAASRFEINTARYEFTNLSTSLKEKLFNVLVDYSQTPLNER